MPKRPACKDIQEFATIDCQFAVDEEVFHARGVLMRFVERGRIAKCFGIEAVEHPEEPLVILNYDQLNSPRSDAVVRQCRGITLEKGSWRVVAKAFDRFFNWGELAHEKQNFDWSNFLCQTKEDGSLILIYHYGGAWRANTRGSFGGDNIRGTSFSWRKLVWEQVPDPTKLDPALTYVCEVVSPHTQVVRRYAETRLYLLTTFVNDAEQPHELADEFTRDWAAKLGMARPEQHAFHAVEQIQDWLREQEVRDPSFEGVVVRDSRNQRWKIKNRSYLSFHGFKHDPDALTNPRYLLPFILNGEDAELLTYYPEVAGPYARLKQAVEEEFGRLRELWLQTRAIADQKAFAQAIQKRSPFTGLLFALRKLPPEQQQSEAALQQVWRQSELQIFNWLKPKAARLFGTFSPSA